MGLRAQTVALVAVGLLVLWTGIGGAAWSAAGASAAEADARLARQVQADAAGLLAAMADQRSGLRAGATATDGTVRPELPDREAAAAVSGALAAETRGGSLAAAADSVRSAMAQWQAWADGAGAGAGAADAGAGDALFARFRVADEGLSRLAAGRAAASTAEAAGRARLTQPFLLLAASALTVDLWLLAVLLVAATVQPLLRLARTAGDLAAGAGGPVPGTRRRDEVGVLARSLQAWQESEALRRALIDHAPVGIARMDVGGRFLSGNPVLCRMLGCSEGELRQLRDSDVTDPADLLESRRVREELAGRLASRAVLEKRYVRKDGSSFRATLTVAPVLDRTGQVQSLVALIEDVSHHEDPRERAAEVQESLLPSGSPPLDGYELAARCVPAFDVGGDFFDWYVSSPGELTVTLGDVMGKGMSAALLMATIRSALRAGSRARSLTEPLRLASDTIALDFEHADTFITLLHARLNQRTGRLAYVDAGHGYCAILRQDGDLANNFS